MAEVYATIRADVLCASPVPSQASLPLKLTAQMPSHLAATCLHVLLLVSGGVHPAAAAHQARHQAGNLLSTHRGPQLMPPRRAAPANEHREGKQGRCDTPSGMHLSRSAPMHSARDHLQASQRSRRQL